MARMMLPFWTLVLAMVVVAAWQGASTALDLEMRQALASRGAAPLGHYPPLACSSLQGVRVKPIVGVPC
jgi:hypothetical protein